MCNGSVPPTVNASAIGVTSMSPWKSVTPAANRTAAPGGTIDPPRVPVPSMVTFVAYITNGEGKKPSTDLKFSFQAQKNHFQEILQDLLTTPVSNHISPLVL